MFGSGGIGPALIRKLAGFGLARILGHDPYLTAERVAGARGEAVALETLLREADFVSLHTPLTEDTRGMVGPEQRALMKPSAILINTSRRAVGDEAALVDGTIAAAGLHVFETERVPADSPLTALDNILNNHLSWYTVKSSVELATKAAPNISEVLSGRPPLYPVNRIE